MKIKGFIICSFVVVLFFLSYFLLDMKGRNLSLNKKYAELSEIVKQNELDRDFYFEKQDELDKLKEENKDKIIKYEKVKKWNDEIASYLEQ
jgi:hypothetical protein